MCVRGRTRASSLPKSVRAAEATLSRAPKDIFGEVALFNYLAAVVQVAVGQWWLGRGGVVVAAVVVMGLGIGAGCAHCAVTAVAVRCRARVGAPARGSCR